MPRAFLIKKHSKKPRLPGTVPCSPGAVPCSPGAVPCSPGTVPCSPGTPPSSPSAEIGSCIGAENSTPSRLDGTDCVEPGTPSRVERGDCVEPQTPSRVDGTDCAEKQTTNCHHVSFHGKLHLTRTIAHYHICQCLFLKNAYTYLTYHIYNCWFTQFINLTVNN